MAKRTKKVGPVGRFGSRYGVRARMMVRNVELVQKSKHKCPSCGHLKVRRVSTSIWQCRKCNVKFAGGAYYPKTEAGQNIEKMISGEIKISTTPPDNIEKKQDTEKVEGEK
jgi:large subunit ribosomal protein L37Ae